MSSVEKLFWSEWKDFFCRLGMHKWIASALELAGPFTFLGSQILNLSNPYLQDFFSNEQLEAMSNLLEDPARTKAFATYLREGV